MSELLKTIDIQISDCDLSGRWRPAAVQCKLLEMGEEQAASFGLSYAELLGRGMCWVLYRYRINLRAVPRAYDAVRATTWPGIVEGPIFPRYFTLEKDGERIGEAVTAWVLIDVEKRRPLRPSALEGELPTSEIPPPLPLPGALRIENAPHVTDRQVRYADIDIIGHMNNAKYLEWACDLLPLERLRRAGIRKWQINYVAEALPGETLSLFMREEADDAYILGRKGQDGRVAFEAKITYGDG